jgi:KEOPS complex subunit Pcc1
LSRRSTTFSRTRYPSRTRRTATQPEATQIATEATQIAIEATQITADSHDAERLVTYPHRTTLSFAYPDERHARLVADAITVESGEIDDDRSTADVTHADATVTVTVAARDLTAMRAGINTWTRLVSVAETVAGVES